MTAVIRIVGLTVLDAAGEKAIDESVPEAGRYVRIYVADGNLGRGYLATTPVRQQAFPYPTAGAAAEAWRRQSRTHPFRPDNEPNRPLTAFTVEILPDA